MNMWLLTHWKIFPNL